MSMSEQGSVGSTGAKATIAGQLEQELELLDRLQKQGHLVTNCREVRASLVDLLARLRNAR